MANPAAVVGASAYRGKSAGRYRGLAVVITAPTGDRPVRADTAGVVFPPR